MELFITTAARTTEPAFEKGLSNEPSNKRKHIQTRHMQALHLTLMSHIQKVSGSSSNRSGLSHTLYTKLRRAIFRKSRQKENVRWLLCLNKHHVKNVCIQDL
jgi:hypothetical protein